MCVVHNKRTVFAVFCALLFGSIVSARAQVVPSAEGSPFRLYAGAEGSMYQPDYAGEGIAQESPQRLYGIGGFVDVHFNRWAQIEGEAHWLRFNQYLGISEDTYLIGPRIAPWEFHGLVPYGKVLVGMGTGSFLTGNTLAVAYGGGVDYHLSKRFSLRCVDFEYQQWNVTPSLHPYGGSVGLSYRIF
jgi:hypothetical protein